MPSLTISLSLKSRLRSSTRGDSYGVLGFNPSLVFDFKNNYFRKSATDSTFGASITHAATTNATMTDGYGPNLVTNGTFDSDLSGWEASHGTLSHEFDNGTVKLGHTVYNSWTRQVLSGLVVGNTYEVSFSVTNDTQGGGGGSYVGIWETNSDASYIERFTYTKGVVGSYTFTFTATSTVSQIRLTKGSNTGVTNFDNVSVREAPAIKWRPHNLIRYSEDLTASPWTKSNSTATANATTAPDGSTTADLVVFNTNTAYFQQDSTVPSGISHGQGVYLKYHNHQWIKVSGEQTNCWVDIQNGVLGTDQTGKATLTDVGAGWYFLHTEIVSASSPYTFLFNVVSGDNNPTRVAGGGVYLWGAHVYRSDLGGMVNNPTQSAGFETYVPTSGSARYLPRVGHHIYNGSAWVNEGILYESEARTNQMVYSGDLNGTGWTGGATSGTVTAGSPFGTYQTISPSSNGGNLGPAQRYQIGKPLTSGATYVGWALVKYSAGSGWFAVNMYNTGPKANEQAYFDLQNGVVGSKQPLIIDHGMVDYGDGWWLCWASSDSSSISGGLSLEMPNGDGVQSCSLTDVILIAGTQFELKATPSSYIPTTSATVTRAAETLTVPAANMPWPEPVEVTGTELLTNSEFDDGLTGWTDASSAPSFWSVSGGVATQNTNGAAVARLRQSFTTVVGKVYKVSFVGTLDGYAIGTTAGNSDILPFGNRTDGYFVAVGTTTWFGTANNTDGRTLESVSAKEINPLSVSIQMDGRMTFADTGIFGIVQLHWWQLDANNRLSKVVDGAGTDTGRPVTTLRSLGVTDYSVGDVDHYSPGINVPFNYADRYGSTFVNSALEGTALTANTTPTALPYLQATDFEIGRVFMGTIGGLRVWADDLGDTGIVEASAPSLEPSLSLTFDGSQTSFTVSDWSE